MNTVLLISNVHLNDSGGRSAKFAARQESLCDVGWNMEVLHVSEPYVWSFLPAIIRGVYFARRKDIDIIHSVNNPFHLHLIGFFVALFSHLPWLSELRDALTTDPSLVQHSLRSKLREVVEWLVAKKSTRLVWLNGIQVPEKNYFQQKYDLPSDRTIRMPHTGYVAEKFDSASPRDYDKFTIVYAGSFYKGWIEPYNFLEGFSTFTKRKDIECQFLVYGDWLPEYQEASVDAGVLDQIETHDFVPHEEIVSIMIGADVLLYIGGTETRNARNIPSKLADYLGARSPILGVVDPSFRSANWIRTWDLGLIARPSDPNEIAGALESIYTGSYRYDPDPEALERFTRQNAIDALQQVLDELVEHDK